MTQQEALYASVLEFPADDTPRMMYADWLEENGDGERAEFCRVQIGLASGPNGIEKAIDIGDAEERQKWLGEVQWLARRQRELLTPTNKAAWFADLILMPNPPGTIISRGFISHVTASWEDFQRIEPSLLWWPARMCEKCDGSGKTYTAASPSGDGAWQCSACRGTGSIPGATMRCPDKPWKQPGLSGPTCATNMCKTCSGSGRIPRPVTLAMQPVVEVTLTTWPDWGSPQLRRDEEHEVERRLRPRWPSVEKWNLPRQIRDQVDGLVNP